MISYKTKIIGVDNKYHYLYRIKCKHLDENNNYKYMYGIHSTFRKEIETN